jgi:hypothetical protein
VDIGIIRPNHGRESLTRNESLWRPRFLTVSELPCTVGRDPHPPPMRPMRPRLTLTALLSCCVAVFVSAAPRPIGGWKQAEAAVDRPSTLNCTWGTFNQTLDHFGAAPGTFPQRYCVYSNWWRDATYGGFQAPAHAPGPIFFYTGNESPVEEYINVSPARVRPQPVPNGGARCGPGMRGAGRASVPDLLAEL